MAGGFRDHDARRIAHVVRTAERTPHRPQKGPGVKIVLPDRNALTTGTITARSGTTKGYGNVTLYVDDESGSGAMVVLETGVKVWNAFGSSIPSGKWVIVGVVDGLLQVKGADC